MHVLWKERNICLDKVLFSHHFIFEYANNKTWTASVRTSCVQALFSVFHINPNYLDFILNVKILNVDRNTPFGQHFFMIVNSVLRASSELIMYYWRAQYLRRFKNTLFRKRILFSLFYFALCSYSSLMDTCST